MDCVNLYHKVQACSGAFKSDTIQTTDATNTVLYTVTVPTRCTITIVVRMLGFSSGSALTSRFYRSATFKQGATAGTITQCGTTRLIVTDDESNGSTNCNYLINGSTVQIRTIGLAATTFNWRASGLLWVLSWP